MTERTTAEILQRLFPGQPHRHIRWTHTGPDGRKGIGTLHRGAAYVDYVRHLRPETAAGPGMLGVMPGIQSEGQWRTPWAMLDFDSYGEGAVETFRAALDRHGMNYALTTGTTGRGTHIWFLLDELVTTHKAAMTLAFLDQVAGLAGVTKLDCRPQFVRRREGIGIEFVTVKGSGILLPYRGADLDGRGENPLSLPTGEVVPLQEADSIPKTSAALFLEVGRRRHPRKFVEGRSVRPRPAPQPRLPSMLRESASPELWAAELHRLGALWTEGRRHHLTLAATAYGLSLQIPPEQITEDLLTLARGAGDPELEARRASIERTLKRKADGSLVAFHRFYSEAGVDSPAQTALPIVREQVADLLGKLMNEAWPGKGGKTDRSLFKTLLGLAWQHGHPHPHGIELSVAWGQLAQEADVGSSQTLSNSLLRLEHAQAIRRGAIAQGTKSGSFILLVTERSTPTAGGGGDLEKAEEYFGLTRTLRYGPRRLGKRAEHLLDLLLWNGPMSKDDLANQLNTRVIHLKEVFDALEDSEMIFTSTRDGRVNLADTLDKHLADREQLDGSEKARKDQKTIHQDRREQYGRWLKKRGGKSR